MNPYGKDFSDHGIDRPPSDEVDAYLASRNLNSSQKHPVRAVLMHATGQKGLTPAGPLLIQGPPGTGKTTTLAALLVLLVEATEHQRIMACAPTNTALGEVGRRLLDHIKSKKRLSDLRAESSSLSRSKPASPFPHRVLDLSEVVLVAGSPAPGQSGLASAASKLEELLEPISLRPHMKRLADALGGNGLLCRLGPFWKALSTAPAQHREYQEAEKQSRSQACGFIPWLKSWLSEELKVLASQANTLVVDAPHDIFQDKGRAQV